MDLKFLKEVQSLGWHINGVLGDEVRVSCPAVGCGMKAKLKQGSSIPFADPGSRRNRLDVPLQSYDDLRRALRGRREDLALTILEVEEIGGIATDHLAKFEKDAHTKMPNAQTLIEWVQALGYELVLRPADLTPFAMRVVCDTRDKVASRSKRFTAEGRRRNERAGQAK